MTHYYVTNIRPDARAVLAAALLALNFAAETETGDGLRLCWVRMGDLPSIVTVHHTADVVSCASCLNRLAHVPK